MGLCYIPVIAHSQKSLFGLFRHAFLRYLPVGWFIIGKSCPNSPFIGPTTPQYLGTIKIKKLAILVLPRSKPVLSKLAKMAKIVKNDLFGGKIAEGFQIKK